jgi:hypothetical protein
MHKLFVVKTPSAYVDRQDHQEKTRWVTVGRAFVKENAAGKVESIGIQLDAFPFTGNLRAFPADSNPEAPAKDS